MKVFGVIALIGSLFMMGCASKLPTYRFLLTVKVETPEGLRSGSSVIEVMTSDQGKGFPGPEAGGIRFQSRGEAVAVDLPGDQVLFLLFNADWAGEVMPKVNPDILYGDGTFEQKLSAIIARREPIPLPRHFSHRFPPPSSEQASPSAYPRMVTFADLDDPTSVELVNPDNLAASFGEGVKLKSITVQITDAPVTTGIEKRLVWLRNHRNLSLAGNRFTINDHLADNLFSGNFSTAKF